MLAVLVVTNIRGSVEPKFSSGFSFVTLLSGSELPRGKRFRVLPETSFGFAGFHLKLGKTFLVVVFPVVPSPAFFH
jgi:hypothetical protein